MSQHHCWLSEAQLARRQPLLPNKSRGVPRVDDQRVISGIIHVPKTGCRWRDAPPAYWPHKTLYNRFVRWAAKGVWEDVFRALSRAGGPAADLLLDSTHAKAHRCADAAYDSDGLRRFLARCTTEPVIKPNPTRKRPAPYDRAAFRARNAIARMFLQLKDWRRVATRYDKLEETYSATVQLAATVLCWL